jgi:glucoamylase
MYVKLLAVVEALLLGSAVATPTATFSKRQSDIESFISNQRPVSLNGILANIGPDGSGAQGASAGIVVASPSKSDPNCKTLFSNF